MNLTNTPQQIARWLGYKPSEYEDFRSHAPMHFLALCDRTMELDKKIDKVAYLSYINSGEYEP